MPNRLAHRAVATLSILGVLSGTATAQSFVLRGAVRDFPREHPDFGGGLPTGHTAGHAPLFLETTAPMYAGAGFEVESQWRDRLSNPIAPHMFNKGKVIVEVVGPPKFENQSYADSYNSSFGHYDPSTAGDLEFIAGSTMPDVEVPDLDVPWQLSYVLNHKGTTILDHDLHVDNFGIYQGHTLEIRGNITAVVENQFELRNGSRIKLRPGSRFTIYYKGTASIEQSSGTGGGRVGEDPTDAKRLTIINAGTQPFLVQNHAEVYATLISPNAPLRMDNNTDFYGVVTAQSVHLSNSSGLHIDGVPALCDITIQDAAGSGGGSGASITSKETYSDWFTDKIGVNLSRTHMIVMRADGEEYEYDSGGAFYPIDDKLYGNQGDPHNNYFTYSATATFTYQDCAGQSVWFEGSDDCWIYLDDRLIIDLGGAQPGTGQYAELDRLGFEDGQEYTFKLFYAHRSESPPRFNLRTNFPLVPDPVGADVASMPLHD